MAETREETRDGDLTHDAFDLLGGARLDPWIDPLVLTAPPGSEHFDMPGLHGVRSMARAAIGVEGDFTLAADVDARSLERKFDAAGLFLEIPGLFFKFGVERLRETGEFNRFHIASTKTDRTSDEVLGAAIGSLQARLLLTRSADIVTCYWMDGDARLFHRAFHLDDRPGRCRVGFFVQTPFGLREASAAFGRPRLTSEAVPHQR